MYEQEITETKVRKKTEISEIDGRLQEQYEARLQGALQELRENYEEQLKNNRIEVESIYETKVLKLLLSLFEKFSLKKPCIFPYFLFINILTLLYLNSF